MEFFLDYVVAFARVGLQTRPVKHRNVATVVTDQSGALQIAGGLRDAFPRTPSILAINSCVMVNSFEGSRSRVSNSQRHSCCSTE